MNTKFLPWCRTLFPILACLSIACTETPPPDEEEIVARVAREPIGKSELEEFAAMLLPGLRPDKSGREGRLEYLQSLIDEKLLVLEARARGLDTTGAFKTNLQKRFSTYVVGYYRTRHLYPRIDVTEAEVRDRFIQDGLNRERALWRLVVATAEEAARLREETGGQEADFADLAKAHTLEKSRAPAGGYLGFVHAGMAARLQVPRQVFNTLPPGEVSQPVPLRNFYQLILFGEERAGDFHAGRDRIMGRLGQEKLALLTQATTEELASELDLAIRSEGLKILLEKKKEMGSRRYPQLSPPEAATPLYTYEGGEITVGEYIDNFRTGGGRLVLEGKSKVDRAARRRVLPGFMLWEAARRQGYHELEPMLEWKERETIDQLITALRQQALSEVAVTEDEAEQFYHDNPDLFIEPEEVEIQEILVDDEEQAIQLRQRLDTGEKMDSLIHLSRHPGAWKDRGKRHLHPWERSEMARQAFAAPEGRILGPVPTEHGHTVFRVLEKKGGRVLPFQEAVQAARTHVRFREETRVFNELLAALREKYADRVQIFEEKLGAVQLPAKDALPPEVQRRRQDRLYRLGVRYFEEARYDEVVEVAQELLRMDSLLVEVRCNLGIAYQKLGRMEEAVAAYQSAIRIDSTYLRAYHNLAQTHVELGDFPSAFSQLDAALRIEPESADTYLLLAFFYSAQGRFDREDEALSKAVAVDPGNAKAWQVLGSAYRKLGRSEPAEAALLRAVELDPNSEEAWNELGGLYSDAGRYDEADRAIQRALDIDPDYAEAYFNLAQLRSAQGKTEEAQTMLERFESLPPRTDQMTTK